MKNIVIAIDGFSGTGKSSTAKAVAKELNYIYVDSGAMYRAITYFFLSNKLDYRKLSKIGELLVEKVELQFINQNMYLNGENVENYIRSGEVNEEVSKVSAIPEVRQFLLKQQQTMGSKKGVVMDGRDIGSIVFPDAELKIFMTADVEVRAKRRQLEYQEKGIEESLDKIKSNLLDRDKLDSTRKISPLIKADDSFEIDTSHITLNQQINDIIRLAKQKKNED